MDSEAEGMSHRMNSEEIPAKACYSHTGNNERWKKVLKAVKEKHPITDAETNQGCGSRSLTPITEARKEWHNIFFFLSDERKDISAQQSRSVRVSFRKSRGRRRDAGSEV